MLGRGLRIVNHVAWGGEELLVPGEVLLAICVFNVKRDHRRRYVQVLSEGGCPIPSADESEEYYPV